MTEKELSGALTLKLLELYGLPDGIRTAGVVVPGIIKDFRSMLMKAETGRRIREEYRTEDLKAVISLCVCLDVRGQAVFESFEVRPGKE